MSSLDRAVRALLVGSWERYDEALSACKAGEWLQFEQRVDPRFAEPPGFFEFSQKKAFRQCKECAQSIFEGPTQEEIEAIPLWIGDNYDGEEPRNTWYRGHALRREDGDIGAVEPTGPVFEDFEFRLDTRVICQIRAWTVGVLVASTNYAPSISIELRAGRFGVVKEEIVELKSFTVVADDGEVPKPDRLVPPYCSWYEPRVAGLSQAMVEDIQTLSLTVDEEGEVVEDSP